MEDQYAAIILETMGAKLIWSLSSDIRFFSMLYFGGYDMTIPAICASIGASVGVCINYALGMLLSPFQGNGVSVIPQEKYDLWKKRLTLFAPAIGLLSWFFLLWIVVFAAGFFRTPFWRLAFWLAIGQTAYYICFILLVPNAA